MCTCVYIGEIVTWNGIVNSVVSKYANLRFTAVRFPNSWWCCSAGIDSGFFFRSPMSRLYQLLGDMTKEMFLYRVRDGSMTLTREGTFWFDKKLKGFSPGISSFLLYRQRQKIHVRALKMFQLEINRNCIVSYRKFFTQSEFFNNSKEKYKTKNSALLQITQVERYVYL